MDQNEILEPYTAKDFGKDMIVAGVQTVVSVAAAYVVILAVGFVVSKVQDRKAKKTSAKN